MAGLKPERTAVCGTCCFFQPHPWDETVGTCRRTSPYFEGWPHVNNHDWCAEHYGGDVDPNQKPEVVN